MIHPWHDVTPGDKLPTEFSTVIEIPFGSSVKYDNVRAYWESRVPPGTSPSLKKRMYSA